MSQKALIRQESVGGFWFRLIVAVVLPVAIVVAVLSSAFAWRQKSPLGLRVDYFASERDAKPIVSRTYRKALIYDAEGSPARGVPAERYFAVWSGLLLVPSTATYEFSTFSDDGIRVSIDGLPLIDNWMNRGWKGSGMVAEIELAAGGHSIRIEHSNRGGPSGLALSWGGGDIPENTILATPYIVKEPL